MPAAHADVLCNVHGTVETGNGSPASGVTVDFSNDSGHTPGTTDAAGTFAFAAVCGAGEVRLSWSSAPAADYPSKASFFRTATVTDGKGFSFHLPYAVTASLRVVDSAGAPLAGVLVGQANENYEYQVNPAALLGGEPLFDATVESKNQWTDANGQVSFRTFPDWDMHLMAYPTAASGLRARDIVLNVVSDVSSTLTLTDAPPGTAKVGFVRDSEGNGIGDVSVGLDGVITSMTRSNGQGLFTVYGPEGQGQLGGGLSKFDDDTGNQKPRPLHTPREFRFSDIPVTVGSGGPVEVTMPKVSRIRIKTVDTTGRSFISYLDGSEPLAISDPAVLVSGTPAVPIEQRVDPYFNYSTEALEFLVFPTTSITGLRLWHYDLNGDTVYADVPPIDARTDQELTVVFPAPAQKYEVTGTLTDAYGKPIPGMHLSSGGSSASVDATGHFTLLVSAGNSTIHAGRGQGYAGWKAHPTVPNEFGLSIPISVAGDMEVAFRLPRAYEVTMRITDPSKGNPVKGGRLRDWEENEVRIPFSGLTVQGASGPASAEMPIRAAQTDADGVHRVPVMGDSEDARPPARWSGRQGLADRAYQRSRDPEQQAPGPRARQDVILAQHLRAPEFGVRRDRRADDRVDQHLDGLDHAGGRDGSDEAGRRAVECAEEHRWPEGHRLRGDRESGRREGEGRFDQAQRDPDRAGCRHESLLHRPCDQCDRYGEGQVRGARRSRAQGHAHRPQRREGEDLVGEG